MHRRGFVLITALTMLVVLMALLTAYFTLTRVEVSTTASTANATTGFYAAEAGLNLRAEAVKGMSFSVTGPQPTLSECVASVGGGSLGSYGCWRAGNIQGRVVDTLMQPADAATASRTGTAGQVAPGEAFAGLRYTEFIYDLKSQATLRGQPEAILGMRFKERQIPLFQFMAFYEGDLELGPGPQMTINGPMHTNGSMYLSAANGNPSNITLDISGQVTAVGNLVRGRKNGDSEQTSTSCPGAVRVRPSGSVSTDPNSFPSLSPTTGGSGCPYQLVTNFSDFGGAVRAANAAEGLRVNRLRVPSPASLEATRGSTYWDSAELRVVLNTQAPVDQQVEVRNSDGTLNTTASDSLRSCRGLIEDNGRLRELSEGRVDRGTARATGNFYNFREQKMIQMLDVDMKALFDCVAANNRSLFWNTSDGRGDRPLLNDRTDNGLILYFSVFGPDSSAINNYGVRIRNGDNLNSTTGAASTQPCGIMETKVCGLTVVSDQAVYLQGDYNSVDKKPAAVLADSLNILSNAWKTDTANSPCKSPARRSECTSALSESAESTTVNAAFLAGVDETANGAYNGGLQNYPRFHENWDGRTLTYRGSFVSLGSPRRVNGLFPSQRYRPPARVWSYDTDFNDSSKLPPLTPTVTQLEQELFSREFEQR